MVSAQKEYDVMIVGAGAGGLALNFQLARSGLKVLLLDRQNRAGRKLLISGGGKCNVTNLAVGHSNYLGQNPQFCEHALSCLPPSKVLEFLDEHKILWEERELGQIFLVRGADELRDLLVRLGKEYGSAPVLSEEVLEIRNNEAMFEARTRGKSFFSSRLVIAAGSPAWPSCGASASGFSLAKSLGHTIVSPRPALTPLGMPENWPLKELAGISLLVKISANKAGAKSYTLPLMVTHQGISGPGALQASSWLSGGDGLVIDWLPGESCEELFSRPGAGKPLAVNLLSQKLPARLVKALIPSGLGGRKTAELSRKDRNEISDLIHNYVITPLGPDFSRAEACRGGVDTSEVNPYSMESLVVKNLFFAGEVLDVCGELGGYNLHWAWASAKVLCAGICGDMQAVPSNS